MLGYFFNGITNIVSAGFFYDIVDPLLINAFVNDLNGDWKAFSKGADPKTGLIDD
jgi:hypothetical protein